jgi:hypothetical protein
MFEFGASFLKGLAAPVPSVDPKKKIKTYEVMGGDVLVWTGSVLLRFDGMAQGRMDGMYDFEFHQDAENGYAYSPWLAEPLSFQHGFGLTVLDVQRIHNIISAYCKTLGPDDPEPMAMLKVEKSAFALELSLELMCNEQLGDITFNLNGRSGYLEPSLFDDDAPEGGVAPVKLTYNAQDLLDALAPFTKIKRQGLKVNFMYNLNRKGETDGPVWIATDHIDRRISVGLTYEFQPAQHGDHDTQDVQQGAPDTLFMSAEVLKAAGKAAKQTKEKAHVSN